MLGFYLLSTQDTIHHKPITLTFLVRKKLACKTRSATHKTRTCIFYKYLAYETSASWDYTLLGYMPEIFWGMNLGDYFNNSMKKCRLLLR